MLDIYVCVGSSCHLKGSYQIINCFQRMIKENNLESKVELKASFCMGHCTTGVCVKIGDTFYSDVGAINAESFFNEKVFNTIEGKKA
ncbi:(2Fe-2S) ferredoxin domain-containing protein [Ruminiclostridium josui]|uniref:(2Fe-2S) ferredoxin domain-containing protein n=1 Tax=Ruminiclostridium josui TaxID=1499 RepID=UPI0004643B75|nr:(2Fe-2S) ferredoxin domain-containing protein [Ruminiclostridium josui]